VFACTTILDGALAWCPLTSGIWFYQVEMGDAGETIEPEESQ
jgi:hypothetical protein